MWDWIKNNLSWILPLCMPVAFFLLNALTKWGFNLLNVHLLGADTGLCGCSLFSGTLLRQIWVGKLNNAGDIVTAFALLIGFLIIWVGCLLLGKPGKAWMSLIAALPGSLTMFLCEAASSHVLQ